MIKSHKSRTITNYTVCKITLLDLQNHLFTLYSGRKYCLTDLIKILHSIINNDKHIITICQLNLNYTANIKGNCVVVSLLVRNTKSTKIIPPTRPNHENTTLSI